MAVAFRRGRFGGGGYQPCCSPTAVRLRTIPPLPPETSRGPRLPECAHAARAREQQRDAEDALLRSELQEHPDDAEGWSRLGRAYGNTDAASATSAIDAFDHATRLAPNVAVHWKHLGEAHWSNERAIRGRPNYPKRRF